MNQFPPSHIVTELWRWRAMVASFGLLGAVVGALVGARTVPTYESGALIRVEGSSIMFAQISTVATAIEALVRDPAFRARLANRVGHETSLDIGAKTEGADAIRISVSDVHAEHVQQAARFAAKWVIDFSATRRWSTAPETAPPGAAPDHEHASVTTDSRGHVRRPDVEADVDAVLQLAAAIARESARLNTARSAAAGGQADAAPREPRARQRARAIVDGIFRRGVEVGQLQRRVESDIGTALAAPVVQQFAPWYTLPLRLVGEPTTPRQTRSRPVQRLATAGALSGFGVVMLLVGLRHSVVSKERRKEPCVARERE